MVDRDTTARWKGAKRRDVPRQHHGWPLREGEVVGGKYEIIGTLGQGGMGAVYHARHVHFRSEVAVKVLHPMLSREELMVRRFEREAQAASHIGSEHIAKVLDTGSFGGSERFMVMEYLEGESLDLRLDRVGKLLPQDVYPIAAQLLEGLAVAHDSNFVHRDLKPSNVFLVSHYEGRDDFVKILDFGVSKLDAVDAGDVTKTGVLLGTPHYMAPELIRGARHADHRSDLYAVGVLLYRAVAGMTPFTASNTYELLHKISRHDAPPLRHLAPDVDEAFAAIVDRALQRDPEARFDDARSFLGALRQWNDGRAELPPLRAPKGSIAPEPEPARAPTTVAPPPMGPSRRTGNTMVGYTLVAAVALTATATVVAMWLSPGSTPRERASGGLTQPVLETTLASQIALDEERATADKSRGQAVAPVPQSSASAPPPPPLPRWRPPVAPKVGEIEF